MKNIFLFLPLLFIFSCKEQAKQAATAAGGTKAEGWTKPMMTAVDAPTTYYDDIEDADFSEYSALVYEVIEQVYAGKLQAYHFIDASPLSIEDVKKSSVTIDTMYVEDPGTGKLEMKIVTAEMAKNISSVKVKETWHFNKETMQLEKKVLGIAPRIAVFNSQTGELRGYTPMFWVFFDKDAEQAFIKSHTAQ